MLPKQILKAVHKGEEHLLAIEIDSRIFRSKYLD
jgi:hypothetical protein